MSLSRSDGAIQLTLLASDTMVTLTTFDHSSITLLEVYSSKFPFSNPGRDAFLHFENVHDESPRHQRGSLWQVHLTLFRSPLWMTAGLECAQYDGSWIAQVSKSKSVRTHDLLRRAEGNAFEASLPRPSLPSDTRSEFHQLCEHRTSKSGRLGGHHL